MKFSYNWIREYVDGLDAPAESLERLITMKTAECESVETVGELLDSAVTARVLSVEPIEGGHNVKAVVDAGRVVRRDRPVHEGEGRAAAVLLAQLRERPLLLPAHEHVLLEAGMVRFVR